MNELIERIFAGFSVGGKDIPVSFLHYPGTSDTYITYRLAFSDDSLSGDDILINYVDYYDFDIYSKGDYFPIIEAAKNILESNDFIWQPEKSSGDLFETDTGYFHKTLNFAYLREEN